MSGAGLLRAGAKKENCHEEDVCMLDDPHLPLLDSGDGEKENALNQFVGKKTPGGRRKLLTTLAGVITDDKCAGKHKGMDKDDAACVRACVKRGANFAIVADGKLYILSGKSTELGALAGQKASVSGDLKGNILTVSSVEAAK